MELQKTIYCDMDGVLADFNKEPNAVERFAVEKGFFAKLEPIKNNVRAIKILLEDGRKVKILSASPNKNADKDKMKWLAKYLPEIKKEDIIICRNGDVKAHYASDIKESVLLDDYGKNCREWLSYGGQAIKVKEKMQLLNLILDKMI